LRLTAGSYATSTQNPTVMLRYTSPQHKVQLINTPNSSTGGMTTTGTIGTSSIPNRYANKFIAPAAWEVTGAYVTMTTAGNNDLITIELLDEFGNTVRATKDLNARTTVNNGGGSLWILDFPTPYTLIKNQGYRINVRPQQANQISGISLVNYPSSEDRSASSMGALMYQSTSNDGLDWADSTEAVMMIGLVIDGATVG
jgi:hypothetical protein